jgi:hypothetical protein
VRHEKDEYMYNINPVVHGMGVVVSVVVYMKLVNYCCILPPYRFIGVLHISRRKLDYKFDQQNTTKIIPLDTYSKEVSSSIIFMIYISYIILTKLVVKVFISKYVIPL